jgi:hypothetical protein
MDLRPDLGKPLGWVYLPLLGMLLYQSCLQGMASGGRDAPEALLAGQARRALSCPWAREALEMVDPAVMPIATA